MALQRGVGSEIDFQSPTSSVVFYNPKYEALYTPVQGPDNPFRTKKLPNQNLISGSYEVEGMDDFNFDEQRKSFAVLGYALDPSNSGRIVGDMQRAVELDGASISHKFPQIGEKRKRLEKGKASDPLNYQGPWAGFDGENVHIEIETKEEVTEEKKEPKEGAEEYGPGTEKTIFHGKEERDYLGRTYISPPMDLDVDLTADPASHDCFLPKRLIHTWSGHTKGVTAIRFFPHTAHLLLSSSMDCKVKVIFYSLWGPVRFFIAVLTCGACCFLALGRVQSEKLSANLHWPHQDGA